MSHWQGEEVEAMGSAVFIVGGSRGKEGYRMSTMGLEADLWALARVKDWPKMINQRHEKRGKEPGTGDRGPRTEWSLVPTTTEKGVMKLSGLPSSRQASTLVLEGLCQIEGT